MARNVFFSFHYEADNWRAGQVRNIGAVQGNAPCNDNDWEAITRGGSAAIQRWIDSQLQGTTCAVVLIGHQTAGRKWINYEIRKAWRDRKGVFGIHIHKLKDRDGYQTTMGRNPFEDFPIGSGRLSSIVHAYDPPFSESTEVYRYIDGNIAGWIDNAISIRNR